MKEYNEEFSEVLKRLTKEERTSICRQILNVLLYGWRDIRPKFPNDPGIDKAFDMLCPSRLKQLQPEFRDYFFNDVLSGARRTHNIVYNDVLEGTINEIVSDALLVYDFIYSLVENGELVMSKDNIARNVGIPVVMVKKAIDFMESCKVIEVKKMDKVNSFCYKLVSHKKGMEIILNYKP